MNVERPVGGAGWPGGLDHGRMKERKDGVIQLMIKPQTTEMIDVHC
jgi:hypothetical protein